MNKNRIESRDRLGKGALDSIAPNYSGAMLARPGLERLRDLVAEGQIEAVLIYAPDQLGRNYAYQLLLTEKFARRGVATVF